MYRLYHIFMYKSNFKIEKLVHGFEFLVHGFEFLIRGYLFPGPHFHTVKC
jgi:hypothetical protein